MYSQISLKPVVLEFSQDDTVSVGFGKSAAPRWTIPFTLDHTEGIYYRAQFTTLLQTIFNDYLHVRSRNCQVVVIEPCFWCRSARDALYSSLLSDFQVPLISFQPRSSMAAIASGLSVGMLVDVGKREANVTCFADSRPIISTSITISFQGLSSIDDKSFEIAEAVRNSIKAAPLDFRRVLARNITLYGNSAEINDISESLHQSFHHFDNNAGSIQFVLCQPVFPVAFLAWIGGSIFSSISSNLTRYVSRDAIISSTCSDSSMKGCSVLENTYCTPDWLSTDRKDWIFVGNIE